VERREREGVRRRPQRADRLARRGQEEETAAQAELACLAEAVGVGREGFAQAEGVTLALRLGAGQAVELDRPCRAELDSGTEPRLRRGPVCGRRARFRPDTQAAEARVEPRRLAGDSGAGERGEAEEVEGRGSTPGCER